jgi:HlyD family secretion protein
MKPCLLLLCLALTACDKPADNGYAGYAEGDYVRLTAPLAGTLTALHVQRGGQAQAGAPAFVLEQASETAGAQEAQSRVARAQAQLADLRKGARPDELAALAAELRAADAALALSRADLARDRKLVDAHFLAQARLDEANAAVRRDQARADQARARLRVGHDAARPDLIAAATREVEAAQAQLAQAQWRTQQKTQTVPVAGFVADITYRVGEWVPAGAPVVTLLPPQNVKARFFLPQDRLGQVRLGMPVHIACDGCGAPLAGHVTFIAGEAEYTAPLIYSKENRAALVFMLEAKPDDAQAARLHPGQPLTVAFAGR